MSRLVHKTAQGPYELKEVTSNQSHWICMCGLSKNQPFCDSSHKKTLEEKTDKVYQYDDDLNRTELEDECCDQADGCACCKKK